MRTAIVCMKYGDGGWPLWIFTKQIDVDYDVQIHWETF